MQRILKITLIIIMIISIFGSFNMTYATQAQGTDGSGGGNGKLDELDNYSPDHYNPHPEKELGTTKVLTQKVSKVLGAIQIIGIVLSVMALMILGIKEMVSSVEERSNIKKAMPVYILGVAMVASMTTLPKIIYDIAQGLG